MRAIWYTPGWPGCGRRARKTVIITLSSGYVNGPTLAQRLAVSGPLGWDEAQVAIGQIAQGLDFAHGRGFDLGAGRPRNILLSPELGAVLGGLGHLPRALFGGGLWSYRQAELRIEDIAKDPDMFAAGLADVFGDLDTDIVFTGSGLNSFPAEMIGGKLTFRGEQAPLLSFPIIEKVDDARYLINLDISDSSYSVALIEMIAGLRKRLPDRYLCATSWGPFTWAMILCDWHLLQEKVACDRTFVQEICDLKEYDFPWHYMNRLLTAD